MAIGKYILPTYTGKLFDLENPIEDMVCIEDIAHHLSIENRYNGATKFPLSVAQHSILVCQMAPEELKLEALLHDAEEAYYKDFTAPLKRLFGVLIADACDALFPYKNFYYNLTKPCIQILIKKFKLKDVEHSIKEIDLRMASTEILQLTHNNFDVVHWQHDYTKFPAYTNLEIEPLLPRFVEQWFLKEYEKWRRD